MLRLICGAAVVISTPCVATDIALVTFDGSTTTSHNFKELNDPVMGGKSHGTCELNTTGQFLIFDGEVVDVPALKAPGFIEAHADGKFPDVSATAGGDLVLMVRSSVEFTGWKVSLASGALSSTLSCAAGGSIPFSRGCFKAAFTLPAGKDFVEVRVPFSTFTDKWNSATGAPVKTCEQDSSTCLTAEKLKKIQRVEIMAEGVAGKVHLEVKSIHASPSAIVAEVVTTPSAIVPLVTFDGVGQHFIRLSDFNEMNDPVMGGKSNGTWTLNVPGKFGIFDGSVNLIPSLKAPGFIKTACGGKYPDASSTAGGNLVLSVRTNTPEYKGFRVSFASGAVSSAFACAGGGSLPFSRGCFKAKFSVPAGDNFQQIKIPFDSFSDKWSPATGEQTKTCHDETDVCPTAKKLAAIRRIDVWAEGVLGKVHLEIQSISAEPATTSSSDVLFLV